MQQNPMKKEKWLSEDDGDIVSPPVRKSEWPLPYWILALKRQSNFAETHHFVRLSRCKNTTTAAKRANKK